MRLLAALLLACGARKPIVETPVSTPSSEPSTLGLRDPALVALVAEAWDARLARYPRWASEMGDHRFDDQVTDASLGAAERWRQAQGDRLARLRALQGLAGADAIAAELLAAELRDDVAAGVCRFETWSFSPRDNPLHQANDLGEHHVVSTVADGANLVARLTGLAAQIDVQAENLRVGLQEGRVANRVSTEKVVEQVGRQLALPTEDWPMAKALGTAHPDWSETDIAAHHAALEAAFVQVREAIARWLGVVQGEVLPAARVEREGLVGLPEGDACYRAMIEEHTTLPLDADTVHATGLAEIARLHGELATLGQVVFGTSDVPTLIARLRDDPALRFTTEDEVEAKAREALERAAAAVPDWFGTLPRTPCTVERVPAFEAPYTTIAYYRPLVLGERPGTYFVNTHDPQSRPRHEAEVLAFHESIPGHHLQIALAQEQGELPLFRRHYRATAYVEGWALYTERLADEMGLYSGDLDRLGTISFELWRASRLVVDTGLHAKGWTRAEAEAYMLAHTPLAANNIVNEVDRYITTPGQALAYKVGQLEIVALRAEAEAALGERFDVAAFHDVVLGGGALTLPLLRQRVEAWIREG